MKRIIIKFEGFMLALGFLTTIPSIKKIEYKPEKLADGLGFAPIIGMIIGLILVGGSLFLNLIFPVKIAAALVLVLYISITGGIHIDGLGDLGDGLMSGKKGDDFYDIMKDSRVGTGGLLAIIIVLFLDYLFLSHNFEWRILFLMPVAGRLGMLIGAITGRYPKDHDGFGRLFVDSMSWKNNWLKLVFISFIFFVLFQFQGLLMYFLIFGISLLMTRYLKYKIGGITGDMCGALVEYCQLSFLLISYILFK